MNMGVAGVSAALLAAVLTGCTDRAESRSATTAAEAPAPPSASPTVSATSATSSPTTSTSPTPTTARPSSPSVPPTTRPPAAPESSAPKPTPLRMTVATRAGRLDLVRGGAAQEFTVTLRNGNTQAYGNLRLAFQMEILFDGTPADERPPSDGFVLERWDAGAGVWRGAELRIANDFMPHHLYAGGAPLARDAVRTDRYRLRAVSAGPVGSTPLMVSLINTGAPGHASPDEARPASFSLPHTTRRT